MPNSLSVGGCCVGNETGPCVVGASSSSGGTGFEIGYLSKYIVPHHSLSLSFTFSYNFNQMGLIGLYRRNSEDTKTTFMARIFDDSLTANPKAELVMYDNNNEPTSESVTTENLEVTESYITISLEFDTDNSGTIIIQGGMIYTSLSFSNLQETTFLKIALGQHSDYPSNEYDYGFQVIFLNYSESYGP
jgi:hypothetical protein